MGPVQPARQANPFEPLPSSLLARHVVQGRGVPEFDRDTFDQLLGEALGVDDTGQPNLGGDVSVNHRLICIILQVGIDPVLEDTPFRTHGSGRASSQILTCLKVLQVAIERSPQVIFLKPYLESLGDHDVAPLYVSIILKLHALAGVTQNGDLQDGIIDVFDRMLAADRACVSLPACTTILDFLRACVSGLMTILNEKEAYQRAKVVIIDGEDFTAFVAKFFSGSFSDINSLKFSSISHILTFLYRIMKVVAKHSSTGLHQLQYKKLIFRLQQLVEDFQSSDISEKQFEEIQHEIRHLNVNSAQLNVGRAFKQTETGWPDSGRPRKRLRLISENDVDDTNAAFSRQACRKLTSSLTGRAVSDLEGLNQTVSTHFRRLSEDDQCASLALLGITACQLTMNSDLNVCPMCDSDGSMPVATAEKSPESVRELHRTLLVLVPTINRQSRARIIAMAALRRIVMHTNTANDMKLSQTPAGDWCLQSLKSSSRDLRITAGRTLQAYLLKRNDMDLVLTRENRMSALEFTQNLWLKGEPGIQETIILALVRMAQVVGDEELNIILVRFVEYLGHTNPYISGVMYAEIQQLAQSMQTTVWALFRPFWRTLGVVFAKSLTSRPNIAQQLCDLLGMDFSGLMNHTAEFALPYLVLHKDQDSILRFAEANGPSSSKFDLCTQRKNLIAIISFLLVQPFTDAESSIIKILSEISGEFEKTDLADWVAIEPIHIACELLKTIGESGQGKSSRIYQALQLLAQLINRQRGQSSASKRSDSIGSFLENNVLAIITHFTISLNDQEPKEPKLEKRRCLAALGEVAKLGKSRIAHALPQLCGCLRSGFDDPELCSTAFMSWSAMVSSLKEDDIGPLINQTLSIIVQTWDVLDTGSQNQAHELVSDLLKSHSAIVRENFSTMPSLASIPLMRKFETEIAALKRQMDDRHQIGAFVARLQDENLVVIEQTLNELVSLLQERQEFLLRSVLREQPDEFVADLTRALLDCSVKFSSSTTVAGMCGQCLGIIGCLDSSKIENIRDRLSMVVVSNFGKAEEVIEWIFFFLQHVLVKAFLSATTTRAQGFLGWAIQEFLKSCEQDSGTRSRHGSLATQRWKSLPEPIQNTLTPFLNSKYVVQEPRAPQRGVYPLYKPGMRYKDWLRNITLDFLHRGPGENVRVVFSVCSRIIHGQDASIPAFLLPYATLNLVVSGIESDSREITDEVNAILTQALDGHDRRNREDLMLCSQMIFEILDYMTAWQQKKRQLYSQFKARSDLKSTDPLMEMTQSQIQAVDRILESIPPEIIAQRALDCKSYSRALFNWEQYLRRSKKTEIDTELQRLQEIYAEIEEPDGVEGISARMHVLDIEQQVLEHRKTGRWTAAQSWYEMQLVARPDDADVQKNLMLCLKESGQHDILLYHFDRMTSNNDHTSRLLKPFALEAAWVTGQWERLIKYVPESGGYDFPSHLGEIMLAIRSNNKAKLLQLVDELYHITTSEMTPSSISSFQSSHDTMLRLHVLNDIRLIALAETENRASVLETLSGRLDILGSNFADKQYLLGVRRAVMLLRSEMFTHSDIATTWLASARLARKAQSTTQAFNAVLKAAALGEKAAAIEQAKLMWLEGHHRKAIQTLEGALESGSFVAHDYLSEDASVALTVEQQNLQNETTAKAHVLLGKWLDQAGQTQSEVIRKTYRKATETFRKWEIGWYHLGRYYNKVLESEKMMPPGKENQNYLNGEATKLVIDNYLRSLLNGCKYVFQTLPKVLTLWLELVESADTAIHPRSGTAGFHTQVAAQRKKVIEETNNQVRKYLIDRLQAVLLYTILPQVVARICHPNKVVAEILASIVARVVRAFPQQAFWSLLAVVESQQKDRAAKGLAIVNKIIEAQKKMSKDASSAELRNMFNSSQKFVKELLRVSEYPIEGKVSKISLSRDLGFFHKIAPSKLVVPAESCLIPSMPTSFDPNALRQFRPFAKEPVTITAFVDEALVLSSLQKPRKLTIRGSDGNMYNVLAKPKDDLRKDQRLMEFNTTINRFLKRDVDAAKRRLYIRTYAVIPLNEECGLIEWVDNLKTFRDILLKLYRDKGISPNYAEIRNLLDECSNGDPQKVQLFSTRILKNFPPVFHEWFVESFPEPSAWFGARLRYTRSCSVMSIVGHVLGLGDRHGENILLEEDNGGIMHVDFNCLFDKGLTFDKPEMVPFRLTHNMVDAMGAYGYEGPWRRCAEITLTLLRNNVDALMTILETFLHDPTTDFIDKGRKKKAIAGVPNTPVEVLESVRGKVKGYLEGEAVPLSEGGYVQEMIQRATSEANLGKMYIGWCAFF